MTKKINTMKKYNYKKISFAIFALCSNIIMYGQTAALTPPPAAEESGIFDLNFVLLAIAVLLLLPFYFTSKTFLFSLKDYLKKKANLNNTGKTIVSIFLLLLSSQFLFAEGTTANNEIVASPKFWVTVTLCVIIALEFIFIIYFSWKTSSLINPTAAINAEKAEAETESAFESFWNKINSFKTKGEEATIDTGHNYDGIRELDNITPPWFTTAFILSIIFAITYLYRYHIAESAPLQIEEYNIEMAAVDAEKTKTNANQEMITADNVKMLGAADIEKGKLFFTANCVSCHGANAASMPGGVGPNLTDEYWIHGGSISNVFNSITNGWPEKGMISWKSQLSSQQIAQISSYVLSVKGSVTTGGKEPQGEIYVETKTVVSDSTNTTDSSIVVK